jgi:peroxiredoxin
LIDEDGRVLAVFDRIQPKQQSAKALKALNTP